MGKFLLNLGYRWSGLPQNSVDGYVFNASGINMEQASRREFTYNEGQWLLFDPQLYLTELDGEICTNTCTKLLTYPWFGIETPSFNSSEMSTKEWMSQVKSDVTWDPHIPTTEEGIKAVVRNCLQFQVDFGVTHLIVPTPLIDNSDDQFGTQIDWLNAAAQLKNEFTLPMFATVAISDFLLAPFEPQNNPLLQTILDNLTVSDFEGIYVLVVQDDAPRIRLTDLHVVQSLLYFSRIAGAISSKDVLVNFADDFGDVCVSSGAIAFVGGTTTKNRRMCLSDFTDRSGGAAYPHFYSRSLIGDYLSKDDLSKIRDARLLRLIESDVTAESEPLLKALRAGSDPNDVPDWRQSRNNVKSANVHRVLRLHQSTRESDELDANQKLDVTLTWLQEAEAHVKLLETRFGENPLSEDGRHVEVWRKAFETLINQIETGEL